jgi:hypothetical protein
MLNRSQLLASTTAVTGVRLHRSRSVGILAHTLAQSQEARGTRCRSHVNGSGPAMVP